MFKNLQWMSIFIACFTQNMQQTGTQSKFCGYLCFPPGLDSIDSLKELSDRICLYVSVCSISTQQIRRSNWDERWIHARGPVAKSTWFAATLRKHQQ